MDDQPGELWRFQVNCPHAERVYLVKEYNDTGKSWLLMKPSGQGNWDVRVGLRPGRYRMTYFVVEGSTYFNCGTVGLAGTRLGPTDRNVVVEPLEQAQPA